MTINYAGSTALITGASAGLGAEFARELAARGANLILVARRTDRLDALASELTEKHKVTVTTLPADLAKPGAASALAQQIADRGLDVTTLINNAGFGTHGEFLTADPNRVSNEVALNVTALTDLTRAFYPMLVKHGTGALVNVASTAAFQPVPLMAVYAATKAYVLNFTEALWYEAKGSGLRVLALCPGATRTEFFEVAGENARIGDYQTAEQVVGLAIKTLDRPNAGPSIISGARNKITAWAERLVSRRALVGMSGTLSARPARG
jgi:short-subunit dehydrogenase